jgi:hypothetical protein
MNQEVRRVQGIVRSHTEVEAEGAHERLVADDMETEETTERHSAPTPLIYP